MDAKQFLDQIIAHFAVAEEGPGDWWAHDNEFASYALQHDGKDGARFWLDLEDDGSITVLWRPPGSDTPIIKHFYAAGQGGLDP